MLKKIIFLCLLLLACKPLESQEPDSMRKGIHQEENEFYSTLFPEKQQHDAKGLKTPSKLRTIEARTLKMKVLGWHPYWASSAAYLSYDYKTLSHLAYFSYEVDTATGSYTTIRGWDSTPVIDHAHLNGTKVLLTVTCFGTSGNTEILTDTVKQDLMLSTLISLLKSRNGDGVNFDLESVASSQRTNLVSFISRAVTKIKRELPLSEISMATPAVDWNNAWDLKKLSELCDYLIVMGYNYYWSTSSTAGPVAPLTGENYNVSKTVTTYLDAGVDKNKLLLGVPWYGYDWPVAGGGRKSPATGKATSRTYSAAQKLADDHTRVFDLTTKVPYVCYTSPTGWHQMWFEDRESLSMKYGLAYSRDLGGIGIWALSYEGGYEEVWETIYSAFSDFDADKGMLIKTYPNPGNGLMKIEFLIAEKGRVDLNIVDITGKTRLMLVGAELIAGFYSEEFDSGLLGEGMYLCVLQTKTTVHASRIIVTK